MYFKRSFHKTRGNKYQELYMFPPQEAEKVGCVWCFASEHGSHNALTLSPLVWAGLRAQAEGHCSVWTASQFC